MNIITRHEGRRGCGYRKPRGLYLVSDGPGIACPKLPIEDRRRRRLADRTSAPATRRSRPPMTRSGVPEGLGTAPTRSTRRPALLTVAHNGKEAQTMTDPETCYRRAAAHWQGCPRCTWAGGEAAKIEDLCPIGQTLTRTWEQVERTWAVSEVTNGLQDPPDA